MRIHTLTDSLYVVLQIFFRQRNQNRFGLRCQHKIAIASVPRIGKNHFTIRIAEQHQCKKNRRRRPGSHDNTIRIYRYPIFAQIKSGNFPSQFRITQRMCIMSQMTIISRFCRFRHTGRHIKIGFANFQMNNINALFLQFVRPLQHIHYDKRGHLFYLWVCMFHCFSFLYLTAKIILFSLFW